MARRFGNKLVAKQVTAITKPGKHSDGNGLYLLVKSNGNRSWVLILIGGGQRREMGLGTPEAVSLAAARKLAADAKAAFAEGRDPIAERAEARPRPEVPVAVILPGPKRRARSQGGVTFWSFADKLIDEIEDGFRNDKHRKQWRATLKTHAANLCEMEIAAIGTDDLVSTLQPIWLKVPETARRVRGRIERVLDAARVAGHREGENPARWKGHLELMMPKQRKSTGHHAAMPYIQVTDFYSRLKRRPATAARALEFAILTAARTGEIIGMTWGEVDFESRLWTIPALRMKAEAEHSVPLTDRAVALLNTLRPKNLEPHRLVFPAQRGGKLSNMAMSMLLRRMGIEGVTVHGFRSSFRDWAGEETNFERETVEMALAHTVGNKAERAYRRGRALAKRRALMDAWQDHCCGSSGKHAAARPEGSPPVRMETHPGASL
ncbi:tyrosine-type recombinase/integrase [Sphingomonas sp. PAMC 26605]|uniref:tyrosine-type recombinase/integrase n=1 Tax=Sphingomonas sp. PAMC 26605 TaxID=1112214 RepID=UPI00026CA22E|nr:site-specific integrase [Sphingomonas sp. PAMC 26605]